MAKQPTAEQTAEKTKPTAEQTAVSAQEPATQNYNKEYHEYKVSVEPVMKKNTRDGGQLFSHYIGEIQKKVKTVRIEPFRAAQLNRTWHSRGLIYIDASEPKPGKIKREPSETDGVEWDDKVIELYKD